MIANNAIHSTSPSQQTPLSTSLDDLNGKLDRMIAAVEGLVERMESLETLAESIDSRLLEINLNYGDGYSVDS